MRKRHRIRRLLKRGLRVRCGAPAEGRCTVTARAKGITAMYASRSVSAGGAVVVRARATREGRRLLRRSRRLRLTVDVAVPGAATRTVTVRARR